MTRAENEKNKVPGKTVITRVPGEGLSGSVIRTDDKIIPGLIMDASEEGALAIEQQAKEANMSLSEYIKHLAASVNP